MALEEIDTENHFEEKNSDLNFKKVLSANFFNLYGKEVLVHSLSKIDLFKKILKEGKLKIPSNHNSPKKNPHMERILEIDNAIYFSGGFYYVADYGFKFSFIFDSEMLKEMIYYKKPIIWGCYKEIVDYWFNNDKEYLDKLRNTNEITKEVVDKYYNFKGKKNEFFDFWRIEDETFDFIKKYSNFDILLKIIKSIDSDLKLNFPNSLNDLKENYCSGPNLSEIVLKTDINLFKSDSFLGFHIDESINLNQIKTELKKYDSNLIIFNGKEIKKIKEI